MAVQTNSSQSFQIRTVFPCSPVLKVCGSLINYATHSPFLKSAFTSDSSKTDSPVQTSSSNPAPQLPAKYPFIPLPLVSFPYSQLSLLKTPVFPDASHQYSCLVLQLNREALRKSYFCLTTINSRALQLPLASQSLLPQEAHFSSWMLVLLPWYIPETQYNSASYQWTGKDGDKEPASTTNTLELKPQHLAPSH